MNNIDMLNVKRTVSSIDAFKELEGEIKRQNGRVVDVRGVDNGLLVNYVTQRY